MTLFVLIWRSNLCAREKVGVCHCGRPDSGGEVETSASSIRRL